MSRAAAGGRRATGRRADCLLVGGGGAATRLMMAGLESALAGRRGRALRRACGVPSGLPPRRWPSRSWDATRCSACRTTCRATTGARRAAVLGVRRSRPGQRCARIARGARPPVEIGSIRASDHETVVGGLEVAAVAAIRSSRGRGASASYAPAVELVAVRSTSSSWLRWKSSAARCS